MELATAICSKEVLASATATLVPIALHLGTTCFGRVRPPHKIKKHTLVIPHKGGKTWLHEKLQSQRGVLVVDVDEHIKTLCDSGKVLRMEKSRIDTIEHDLEYIELADQVLKDVKTKADKSKKLRVLFLTSSVAWASQFKRDACYIASPDSEFWDEIMGGIESIEEREVLRKSRELFIKSLPDSRAITTYNSLKDLEGMVRRRFGITHTL